MKPKKVKTGVISLTTASTRAVTTLHKHVARYKMTSILTTHSPISLDLTRFSVVAHRTTSPARSSVTANPASSSATPASPSAPADRCPDGRGTPSGSGSAAVVPLDLLEPAVVASDPPTDAPPSTATPLFTVVALSMVVVETASMDAASAIRDHDDDDDGSRLPASGASRGRDVVSKSASPAWPESTMPTGRRRRVDDDDDDVLEPEPTGFLAIATPAGAAPPPGWAWGWLLLVFSWCRGADVLLAAIYGGSSRTRISPRRCLGDRRGASCGGERPDSTDGSTARRAES